MLIKTVLKPFTLLAMISLVLIGCVENTPNEKSQDPKDFKEPLMEANRHVVRTEAQHITDLIQRYKWNMQESGSGLRYMIYEEGEGPCSQKAQTAVIEYTVKLITGDLVYSSDVDGVKHFIIGKGDVVSGLEEGILLMNVGDKAKFIIPSHLAFGLAGDGHLIPPKATLIYDVKLLELK